MDLWNVWTASFDLTRWNLGEGARLRLEGASVTQLAVHDQNAEISRRIVNNMVTLDDSILQYSAVETVATQANVWQIVKFRAECKMSGIEPWEPYRNCLKVNSGMRRTLDNPVPNATFMFGRPGDEQPYIRTAPCRNEIVIMNYRTWGPTAMYTVVGLLLPVLLLEEECVLLVLELSPFSKSAGLAQSNEEVRA